MQPAGLRLVCRKINKFICPPFLTLLPAPCTLFLIPVLRSRDRTSGHICPCPAVGPAFDSYFSSLQLPTWINLFLRSQLRFTERFHRLNRRGYIACQLPGTLCHLPIQRVLDGAGFLVHGEHGLLQTCYRIGVDSRLVSWPGKGHV